MLLVIIGIIVSVIAFIVIVICLSIPSSRAPKGGQQIGVDTSSTRYNDPTEQAGLYGEKKANAYLRSLLLPDEYLFNNLLIPLKNGHTHEIDCVMVSRKGIFCIETKNWGGRIKGNDEDEYWTQTFNTPGKKKRYIHNPVLQNEDHCRELERILNNGIYVDNIVLFIDLVDGRKIDSKYAFTMRLFNQFYMGLENTTVTLEEIGEARDILIKYVPSKEELIAYKRRTRKAQQN